MAAEKDITPGCLQPLFSMITSKVKSMKKSSKDDCVAKNIAEPKGSGTPCDLAPPDTKICTVEQWKETAPPQYASVDKTSTFCPPVLKAVDEYIDSYSEELWELNRQIHGCPELAFEEEYAHEVLTEFVEAHGFSVTRHYLGLETAWRADWSNVSPSSKRSVRTIGFNSEMDALPGIGHACGHNLIAIGGVAAALGTKHAMEKCGIEGRVVLLGTPVWNGKMILLKRDAYKEMDACLMMHPTPGPERSATIVSSLALQPIEVEYYGHPAHAGRAPWEGRNALDAAVVAYSSISALRQQMKPTHRVHGIIEGQDWAPNIIPDNSKMRWVARAPTTKEVGEFAERVKECFKAGALATACTMTLTAPDPVQNLRQNSELASEFAAAMNLYGKYILPDTAPADISTDFGNVTYALPGLHPGYAIPTVKDGGNHTRQFTDSAATREAHDITITVAKCIALTGLRVLSDERFFAKVHEAFEEQGDSEAF
ncbi:hypothetical protein BS47DRAFT_1324517 [Hydnum rufescens UP504]|uniref:Peptidase M20 dimerisation domain-containing protein n=1 Tax=Hydnum rufescens UP504 TaxID=1448309 RepID=A0A9P6E1L7_9AGAM|nr:hypothetical protein BS47DRAFT_1324517 [Hydnum rufescens UP504]